MKKGRLAAVLGIAALIIFVFAQVSYAYPTGWTSDSTASTDVANLGGDLDITSYGDNVYVAYENAHGDIYFVYSTDTGETWSYPVRIGSGTYEDSRPQIELHYSVRRLYVAYRSLNYGDHTHYSLVLFRMSIDDDGVPNGSWTYSDSDEPTTYSVEDFRTNQLSDGMIAIAETINPDAGSREVYVSYIYSLGTLQGGGYVSDTGDSQDDKYPSIMGTNLDNFWVIYQGCTPGAHWQVWMAHVTDWIPWTVSRTQSTEMQSVVNQDKVQPDIGKHYSQEIYYVTWTRYVSAASPTVFTQQYDQVHGFTNTQNFSAGTAALPGIGSYSKVTPLGGGTGSYNVYFRYWNGADAATVAAGDFSTGALVTNDFMVHSDPEIALNCIALDERGNTNPLYVAASCSENNNVLVKRVDEVDPSGDTVTGQNYTRSNFNVEFQNVLDDWDVTDPSGYSNNGDSFTNGVVSLAVEYDDNVGFASPTSMGTIDNAPWEKTFVVGGVPDGTYYFRGLLTDTAGNTYLASPGATDWLMVDRFNPTGDSATIVGNEYEGTYYVNSDFEFEYKNVSDDASGVATVQLQYSTEYSGTYTNIPTTEGVNPLTSAPWEAHGDVSAIGDGTYFLRGLIKDRAGNSYRTTPRQVVIDTEKPTVNLSDDSSPNGAGWDNSDVTVTLSCSDPYLLDIEYDKGTGWGTYEEPVVLGNGEYNFGYRAEDKAGNESGESFKGYKIDGIAPTGDPATVTGNKYGDTYYLNSDFEFAYDDVEDTISGVKRVYLQYGNSETGPWAQIPTVEGVNPMTTEPYQATADVSETGDGEFYLRANIKDRADNTYNTTPVKVVIDTTKPTVQIEDNSTPNEKGWDNKTIEATLSSADPYLTEIEYKYANTGGEGSEGWNTYTSPLDFSDGQWTLFFRASDRAGNTSDEGSKGYKIDTIAPVCAVTRPYKDSVFTGFYKEQEITVEGTATDENGVVWQGLYIGDGLVVEGLGDLTYDWAIGEIPEDSYEAELKATDVAGNTGSSSRMLNVANRSTDWYFAEGNTLPEFDEFLCIQNPSDEIANIRFTFMLEGGENILHECAIGAHSRSTYPLKQFVPEGEHVSTHIHSDGPAIICERPMYFSYKDNISSDPIATPYNWVYSWKGGHNVVGATSQQKEWYFAEGTTRFNNDDGFFEEWLCLQNSNDEPANVTIYYMLGTGEVVEKGYEIAPSSRKTVEVRNDVGYDQDVSAKVVSDIPIVAERPMYFDYRAFAKDGHNVMGVSAPAKEWYFAEGCTLGGYQQWLCIQNPNNIPANISAQYCCNTGEVVTSEKTIPPHSRDTIDVLGMVGANQQMSCSVTSDVPVICERPMYFIYGMDSGLNWDGGHDAMGAAELSQEFFISEGTTINNFVTYYCIGNPHNQEVTVDVTYMFGDGTEQRETITIAPHSRTNIDVNAVVGAGRDVSAHIQASEPVAVERPMYFNYGNDRTGGHDCGGYGIN